MDTVDFLETMKRYRHQLMNELQVIHGFQTMGMKEQSLNKMNQFIENLSSERVLQSLDADQYVSWLLVWKVNHPEVQFSFEKTGVSKSIHLYDEKMLHDIKEIINDFDKNWHDTLICHLSYEPSVQMEYQFISEQDKEAITSEKFGENTDENKNNELTFRFRYE